MNRAPSFIVAVIAMVLEVPLLAVIFFGDFGFYFPGAMGAWGDWIAWILAYVVVLACGICAACVGQQVRLAVIQLAAPLMLTFGWWLYATIPEPYYDASKHQFLVGKTLEEVESTLGRRRSRSRMDGYVTEKTPTGEFVEYGIQNYNGMKLLYSSDKRVLFVRKPFGD